MRQLVCAFLLIAACAAAVRAQGIIMPPELMGRLQEIQAGFERLRAQDVPLPPDQYPVRGFDVSHWDSAIQWDTIKGQGFSFAFMKATEGVGYVDDAFKTNWQGAAEAGLVRGAYHFYNFCAGGAAQADNLIRTVPADPDAMAPTIDLEQSASCPKLPAKAAFRKQLALFLSKVEAYYGKQAILYVNGSIYADYFAGENDKNPIWFANPREAPKLPPGKNWTFWQYAFHGKITGISGEVDLDAFNGDKAQFADWVKAGGDSVGILDIPGN